LLLGCSDSTDSATCVSTVDAGAADAGSTKGPITTDPNFKVAFIGDTGFGAEYQSVLQLIKSENANMVMHQGDTDYEACEGGGKTPDQFFAMIQDTLGADFPYFMSVGNHDVECDGWGRKNGYADHLSGKLCSLGVTPDDPDLKDQKYAITYHGLRLVFVGENGNLNEFTSFVDQQLTGDPHIWKICSWHKNQMQMQIGGKPSEMSWPLYEACLRQGAIIATAHEHSYERTKTLTSTEMQVVDPTCSAPDQLCVGPGRTFVFVSGLGGNSIRIQRRCLPTTYPYGCNGEWASIYTTQQNAQFGALFIEFNVDGDPRKARGYFKDIAGNTPDQFTVTAD
jgi:hypothetical protein